MRSASAVASLGLVVGIVVLGAITYVLVVPQTAGCTLAGQVETEVELTGGEFDTQFGFGNATVPVGSPGPELRLKRESLTRVTFRNEGQIPHTFRVVAERKFDAPALFGGCAEIGTPSSPLAPGREARVTFDPDRTGTFTYICAVPGHLDRGMFGSVTVEP